MSDIVALQRCFLEGNPRKEIVEDINRYIRVGVVQNADG